MYVYARRFVRSYVAHYVIKVLIFFVPVKGTFYAYAYVIYYIHTYNTALYTYINACTYMHPQRKSQHPLCSLSGYGRAFTITLYSTFITFFLAFSLCLREGRGGNHTPVNCFSLSRYKNVVFLTTSLHFLLLCLFSPSCFRRLTTPSI